MSINSGPRLPVENIALSLDVFRFIDWNLTKSEWRDSTGRSRGILRGLGAGLTYDNTQGYFNFPLNNSVAEVEIERNGFDLGTDDFSIEAWIYPTSFASETQIFTFDTAAIGTLRITTSGVIQFSSTAYTTAGGLSGWTATLNQWNHIFLTRKDNVAYGYLNGDLVGTSIGFNNTITVGRFYIRKASASSGAARIRTVRLWEKSLTENEIKTINVYFKDRAYDPVPTTGLIASRVISNTQATVGNSVNFRPVVGLAGAGGYTYTVSPSLPAGITLNADTGVISGVSSTLFNTTFTMTVRDRIQSQASTTFVLQITPRPLSAFVPTSPLTFGVNSNVSFQPVLGVEGFGNYTYSISPALPASSTPPSLTLNTATGIVSGVPTGYILNQQYTITITDQASQTAQGTFTLIIEAQPISAVVLEPLINLFANTTQASIIPVSASGGESPVSYSISPTLPTGLSFNSANGAVSGTPTAALAQTLFTVTITDGVGQQAQNTFFLQVNSALFNFTSFTFNNVGQTGVNGPTVAQCQSAYSGQAFLSGFFSVNPQGYQNWTVPATGAYNFTVRGANGVPSTGANSGAQGGRGIIQTFQINLTQGTVLRLLVGQSGTADTAHGGGGGASAVLQSPYNTQASIIAIAGGGGGRRGQAQGVGIPGASATTFGGFGTRNNSPSNASIGTITSNNINDSNWAPSATSLGFGGNSASTWGDAGAGFLGNGTTDGAGVNIEAQSLSTTAVGGGGTSSSSSGGFGGGGNGSGGNGGGGGGGFTGGSSGWTAGGGGSFIAAAATNYQEAFDNNATTIGSVTTLFHGFITITKV